VAEDVPKDIPKKRRWPRVKRWLQVMLWLIVLGGAAMAAFGFWEAGAVSIFVLLAMVATREMRN
jgi:fatty acid desaturase